MKKSYSSLAGRHFIRLDNNEVKTIRKAMKICDEGAEFYRKTFECEEEYFGKQQRYFSRAKMYLSFVLSEGSLYYYKKRKKYMENFSKWKKTTYEAHKRKGNLPVFDLKNGRII